MAKKTSRVSAEGFSFVKTIDGISEYILEVNGLRILIKEDHSFPTALLMLTYLVGSRHESKGITGAAHLLEHLMFKGSKNFNKQKNNSLDIYMSEIGAVINASTSYDRTNYFKILPVEHLPVVMKMEADRMRNAFITKKDLEPEMPVVRNEFEMHDNDPAESLQESLFSEAFKVHPYHHPVIGWREDIENMPIEALKKFYDSYYFPNNATLTVLGAIDTTEALKLVKKEFGKIKKGGNLSKTIAPEPKQDGERRVTVSRESSKSLIAIAYKTPAGLHADFPALLVLFQILSGGASSRLHRVLVDKALVSDISHLCFPFKDPFLAIIEAAPAKNVSPEKIESIILAEIEKIKRDASASEVKRTIVSLVAEYQFDKDGLSSIGHMLSEAISIGDWAWYPRYPSMVEKVTVADVKRVAKKYLAKQSRTVGYFIGLPAQSNTKTK